MTTMRARSLPGSNRFKLGIFAANCSGGLAATTVPERWQADWDANLAVAQLADQAGLEFLLPIARWKGYPGASGFQASTFDTIAWACGLLAATRRITVFGTVSAPLLHPILAAKQMVTVDHVGRGRFGLNIVCGWNQDEFEMFDLAQRAHDDRYGYGQEWWDTVRQLWTAEQPFDISGQYIKLKNAFGAPRPWGGTQPVLMNAGASTAGRTFGARNCDYLFTVLATLERGAQDVKDIRALAAGFGRNVEVITTSYVVCRPTRKEAQDYHQHYVFEHGDWEAADRLRHLVWNYTQGRPPELKKDVMYRYAAGHGTYPLIGTPDDIAAEFARIADAGFAGSTISFVDYATELPYFCAEVLPRLERLGLRANRVPQRTDVG